MGFKNPLLDLSEAHEILKLPTEQREVIAKLLDGLRKKCADDAQRSWRRNKAPMAAYWKINAVYIRYMAHALRRAK